MPPETSARSALVLYGSETGTAQDLAHEVGFLCRRLRFSCCVQALDATDLPALLGHQIVIFVLSTTGQGDLPHNSLQFWRKLLRKRLPSTSLSQLRYACFGLGDSTYLKFNWAARKLVRRLTQLGAQPCIEPAEADEQAPEGIDGAFTLWSDLFKSHLLSQYPLPPGLEPIPDDVILPPRWSLEPALRRLPAQQNDSEPLLSLPEATLPTTSPSSASLDTAAGGKCMAELVEVKRMTPDNHWQDVRLFTFDVSSPQPGQRLDCAPGDCLTIYPHNAADDAQTLISLMGWEPVADQGLDLSLCQSLPTFALGAPSPCTLRKLLIEAVDMTAVPRRSFLRSISYFASDQAQRERLLELTSPEFLDDYFDYATRPRRTILELLQDFSSVRIPPDRLLDVFPLIRGRDFSIANGGSSLVLAARPHTARLQLLVALVEYRTILRKPRRGLCSRYLASLSPGARLALDHKAVLSPIHGPANARRPLIAMATGTGIAPVRCLIQERQTHGPPGTTLLFFGCRNRQADFFFHHEWDALDADLLLFPAFSRDQQHKVYVQDLVRQQSSRLAQLMPLRPIFLVCGGSSKMADGCKSAVFDPFLQANADDPRRRQMLDDATWWQEIWP